MAGLQLLANDTPLPKIYPQPGTTKTHFLTTPILYQSHLQPQIYHITTNPVWTHNRILNFSNLRDLHQPSKAQTQSHSAISKMVLRLSQLFRIHHAHTNTRSLSNAISKIIYRRR